MSQKPNYSQWPTKQQVADTLEVSTKSVEKFADEGKLQTALWKRPTGGPKIAVYHPVDVEKLRQERFPGSAKSFVMPAPSGSQTTENGSETALQRAPSQDGIALLNRLLMGETHTADLANRPWLTSAEAVEYTGWPARGLEELRSSGRLPYLDFGRRTRGGRYRFKRADLDALDGVLAGQAVAAG